MSKNLQVGYSIFSRIIIIFGFIMLFIAFIVLVPKWYLQANYKLLLVIGLPNLIFLVILPISLIRYRLTVDESFVELKDYRTRRIYFTSIRNVRIDEDELILKSDDIKLRVSSGISNREQVIEEICSKIRKFPNIQIDGDVKLIEKYFGKKHE